MPTFRVTLEASVPEPILAGVRADTPQRARSWLLSQSWYERRHIEWHGRSEPSPHDDQSLTRHAVRLDLACPQTSRPHRGSLAFALDVATRVTTTRSRRRGASST